MFQYFNWGRLSDRNVEDLGVFSIFLLCFSLSSFLRISLLLCVSVSSQQSGICSTIRVWLTGIGLWDLPDAVGVLSWSPGAAKRGLSSLNVRLSCFDFVIETEVWNKVVSWWCFWLIESSMELSSQLCLSFSQRFLSIHDFIIHTEVWNDIVDWPRWISPWWTSLLGVPWDWSFCWSVFDGRWFSDEKCENCK